MNVYVTFNTTNWTEYDSPVGKELKHVILLFLHCLPRIALISCERVERLYNSQIAHQGLWA